MAFDFLDVVESVVSEGLEGKIIMVFGGNNLGKSFQGTKFPKPMFIPLEQNGLNAIGGVKKLKIHDWASFKDFTATMVKEKGMYDRLVRNNADLTNNKFHQFKQICETLVVDSLTALGKSCEKFIVDGADVQELGDIGHGKLYKRNENEFYRVVNDFMNLGFTVLWIAHEDFITIDKEEDIKKSVPKGDWKRVVKPVIDRCDVVAYLTSNGVDEHGKVIKSSAYLAETEEYFARSKWDNMVTYLEEFTAENLQKALQDAINEQKEHGENVGSFEDQLQSNTTPEIGFDEAKSQIQALAEQIYAHDDEDIDGDNMKRYFAIVKDHLGEDATVAESKPKQVGQLRLILSEVRDLVEELGL
jgi:hypothetical protein